MNIIEAIDDPKVLAPSSGATLGLCGACFSPRCLVWR